MPGPIIIPVQNLPTVILLAIILIKVEQNIARTCKQSPEGIVVVRLLHIATIISRGGSTSYLMDSPQLRTIRRINIDYAAAIAESNAAWQI